jgi:NADH:ubiquinone oxidoreductase subunit C
MTGLDWVESLNAAYGSRIISRRESAPGEIEFTVGPDDFHAFLSALKNLAGGAFEHLADLTSYDDNKSQPRFHVVYELISMLRKQRCSVIVPCADSVSPKVRTVTDLWPGANWLEREVYDLMGISFEGHPDQRRVYLPPSFEGHPLRKDFIVDYRQQFPKPSRENQVFDPFKNTIIDIPKGS